MEALRKFVTRNIKPAINYAGTLLILSGVAIAPIHISIKLIIIGVLLLIAWYTLE